MTISPDVFRWATRRAGLDNAELAKLMKVTLEKVEEWEDGTNFPTLRQVESLAKTLRIPLGYLFLSQPPAIDIPIPDFRTLPNNDYVFISVDLQDVIFDAQRKSDWYREWRISEGLGPFEFVGKYSINHPVNEIADYLRKKIYSSDDDSQKIHSWSDHLKKLINRSEDMGIIVLQSGIVGGNTRRSLSLKEFRGFSIADEVAPLIFINAKDAINARIFTLVHEIAHIVIGEGGISDPDYFTKPHSLNRIEMICNQVAAEFLIPRNILLNKWNKKIGVLENLESLSRFFFVSKEAILRRAFDLNLISREEYTVTLNQIQISYVKLDQRGGGNYYNNLITRNSKRFTQEVIYAVQGNKLTYRAAARLLNTQPDKLSKILDHM